MNRMYPAIVAIAALGAAGIASAHGRGHARFSVGFGFPIGAPVYGPAPVYVAPPPVYYVQPRVVYLAPPPPVYYQPAYVYHPAPVTVYPPVPPVVHERSDRPDVLPAQPQPERPAPAPAPRPYRN